jgi:hypothetical protein
VTLVVFGDVFVGSIFSFKNLTHYSSFDDFFIFLVAESLGSFTGFVKDITSTTSHHELIYLLGLSLCTIHRDEFQVIRNTPS